MVEPNVLESNRLIRDSLHYDLSREESDDCFVASTCKSNDQQDRNEKTKLIMNLLSEHDSTLLKEKVISNIDSILQIRPAKTKSKISNNIKNIINIRLSPNNSEEIQKSPKAKTDKIPLQEENIDLNITVLPDIIKSTSQGSISMVVKECLLGPVLGPMGLERSCDSGENIFKGHEVDNTFKDGQISDSNQQNYSCISISDGHNSKTLEETVETLEIDCDKRTQEHGMVKESNKDTANDLVSSKDSIEQKNDSKPKLLTNCNEQLIEPCTSKEKFSNRPIYRVS